MMKAHIQTILAGAGCEPDAETGALTPPIHMSTTFERAADGSYPHGYLYSRLRNPTRDRLEETLVKLENGQAAAAFASGMAAVHTILSALRPGDHVLIPDDVYYGVRRLLQEVFSVWKLEWSEVDQTDLAAVRAALRAETRVLWVESPSNPMARVVNLAALGELAQQSGAAMVVDSTWTPFLQQPLEIGADYVLHSTTKYIGGHSDALGGILVAREEDELFERVRLLQREAGTMMDPFTAWLTLRGMRSLAYRMRGHCENALRVAEFLDHSPVVEVVHHPSLASHPGHALAQEQMAGFGGMLSFQLKGGEAKAMDVAAKLRVFTRATSLGGTESLVEHRASIEGAGSRTPTNLLRLSVGLEHEDDLVADLAQALDDD